MRMKGCKNSQGIANEPAGPTVGLNFSLLATRTETMPLTPARARAMYTYASGIEVTRLNTQV